MPQQVSQPQTIGLISGESMKDVPQSESEHKDAENTAIETAETIARRRDEVEIRLSDDTVAICRVAKVGQIGIVLRFLRDLAEVMKLESIREEYLTERIKQIKDDPLMIIDIIAKAEGYLWPVMASLSNLKENQLKSLDLDDAMKVGKVLFELNKDFFLKTVLPIARGTLRTK